MQNQHCGQPAGVVLVRGSLNHFLHQPSLITEYWCYYCHRSVRLVILVGLAIDQIAQSGRSSFQVIYFNTVIYFIFLTVSQPVYSDFIF
ncbi:hypothetical protein AYY16_03170 [Morganella psychrotolerans]|nr:hypothetical protein AYY16_03170 [Morganella psychrotolerans]